MTIKTHIAVTFPLTIGVATYADISRTSYLFELSLLALILGAIGPDIPVALQLIRDFRNKKPIFSDEKRQDFEASAWFKAKDITHSPLWWIIPGIVIVYIPLPPFWYVLLLSLGLGICSHWILDLFSHTGEEFKKTDQSLLWPFHSGIPGRIPKLGYLTGKYLWGWEYRTKKSGSYVLKTKTQEYLLQFVCIVVFIWYLLS